MNPAGLSGSFAYPKVVSNVRIEIEETENLTGTQLIVEGKPESSVALSDQDIVLVHFGVYRNIPWYEVAFPGEGREFERHVPDEVFRRLDRLIQDISTKIARNQPATLDITDALKSTGCQIFVSRLTARDGEIRAKHFLKKRDPK
jgi:hypothetical protein